MDDPLSGPSTQPNPPARPLSQRDAFTLTEIALPSLSTQGDMPLLPMEPGNGTLPDPQPNNGAPQRRPRMRRLIMRSHVLLLGTEQGSVSSYVSLLAMTGGLLIAFSSVFGWPNFPIWAFLRR